MKKPILAFIAGVVAWIVVASALNRGLRIVLPGYSAAEPTFNFTLGMMLGRLSLAAFASLVAGAVVAWIAPGSKRTAWVLGLILLGSFIPVHVRLWNTFPIWYHLTFLLTLVPLVVLGARLVRAGTPRVAS